MRLSGLYFVWRLAAMAIVGVLLFSPMASAADVSIHGIDGDALDNIKLVVDLFRIDDNEDTPEWQWRRLAQRAPEQIVKALKPFGFYRADTLVEIEKIGDELNIRLEVIPGPPVTIRGLRLDVNGPIATVPAFLQWREEWPLAIGERLDQIAYEAARKKLEHIAGEFGYFTAQWRERRVEVDETRQFADIEWHYASGPQAVFGQVDFVNADFQPRVLQRFRQIEKDSPYGQPAIDQLRDDLSATGYYESVAIIEHINHEFSPPVVDLEVQLTARKANTYTSTLGFGTDTGPRLQLGWDRHYLSSRGDRLNLALGAQQQDEEFVFRAMYDLPRGNDPGEYWFADLTLLREDEDFKFEDSRVDGEIFPELDGSQEQLLFNMGMLTELGRDSAWPIEQRFFLSFLNDRFDALAMNSLLPEQIRLLDNNPILADNLDVEQSVVAAGASWDLRHISGTGFDIHGTRAQLRVTGALEGVGSDVSFAQVYLGVRHSRVFGERHKLLVRGEIGYSAAPSRDFTIELDDQLLDLSISGLPERYRFKPGGDRSVRGYGFESLSNNRIGSNNMFTLSAEYEYRLSQDWSLAAFYDTGNGFNNFADRDLRRGIGLGVRWYTLVGPVRLDLARALDEPSDSFRIHITIGSPLL